jgi:5'-3' exonuclease
MNEPLKKEIKNSEWYLNNPYLDKPSDEYILIIDANTLLKSSLVVKEYNSNGVNIGAVYQFLWGVKKLLHKKEFNKVFVFWDGENSGLLRYDLYPQYKENRKKGYSEYDQKLKLFVRGLMNHKKDNLTPKQKENEEKRAIDQEEFLRAKSVICELCEDLFFRQLQDNETGVEVDDMIAYVVTSKKEHHKIYIVTKDHDLYQLVRKNVAVYDLSKKIYIHLDNIKDVYGMCPKNVVIQKILEGDNSDNIKGVMGWGNKTTLKYLPELYSEEISLEYVKEKIKLLLESEKIEKKKPSKVLEVAVQCIDDMTLDNLNKIVNLDDPLLSKGIKEELDDLINSPLYPYDRSFENVAKVVVREEIRRLYGDEFNKFFMIFKKVINREVSFYNCFSDVL